MKLACCGGGGGGTGAGAGAGVGVGAGAGPGVGAGAGAGGAAAAEESESLPPQAPRLSTATKANPTDNGSFMRQLGAIDEPVLTVPHRARTWARAAVTSVSDSCRATG